jgi:hypothetical protein
VYYHAKMLIKEIMISIDTQTLLNDLGKRLRALRLERHERQEDFAARLGHMH